MPVHPFRIPSVSEWVRVRVRVRVSLGRLNNEPPSEARSASWKLWMETTNQKDIRTLYINTRVLFDYVSSVSFWLVFIDFEPASG